MVPREMGSAVIARLVTVAEKTWQSLEGAPTGLHHCGERMFAQVYGRYAAIALISLHIGAWGAEYST